MSDLTINCPHCNQELEIPEDLLGQTVECPSCSGSIQLPEPEPKVAPRKIVVRKRTTTKSTRSTLQSLPEQLLGLGKFALFY